MAVPTTFIDFGAFRRGQREALADQFQDYVRQQKVFKENMETTKALEELQDRRDRRAAAMYLSSFERNRREALEAGMSLDEYLIRQRQAMSSDPGYQQLPDMAKMFVDTAFSNEVAVAAANADKAGQTEAARRLAALVGFVSPQDTPAMQLWREGDIMKAAQSAGFTAGSVVNGIQTFTREGAPGQFTAEQVGQFIAGKGAGALANPFVSPDGTADARLRGTKDDPFTMQKVQLWKASDDPRTRMFGHRVETILVGGGRLDLDSDVVKSFDLRLGAGEEAKYVPTPFYQSFWDEVEKQRRLAAAKNAVGSFVGNTPAPAGQPITPAPITVGGPPVITPADPNPFASLFGGVQAFGSAVSTSYQSFWDELEKQRRLAAAKNAGASGSR